MTIDERIERIFRNVLKIEVPSATTNIIENGLLDSLSLVGLVFELEHEFRITIQLDDLDLESLSSMQRIAELVRSRVGEPADSPDPAREARS